MIKKIIFMLAIQGTSLAFAQTTEIRTVVAVEPLSIQMWGNSFTCRPGTTFPLFDTNMHVVANIGSELFFGQIRNADRVTFTGEIGEGCEQIEKDIVLKGSTSFRLKGTRTVTSVKQLRACNESLQEKISLKLEGTNMEFTSFESFIVKKLSKSECQK